MSPYYQNLDATRFEEFCYDLLAAMGLCNVTWRKGTGKQASPADSGRDLEAEYMVSDVDGTTRFECWFVECKHHVEGISPQALVGALSWAHAKRPDVLLIIASNFLSNACKNYLDEYIEGNRPPFRIKVWEGPMLEQHMGRFPDLLDKYDLGGRRSTDEIVAAEQEHADRTVWIGYREWLNDHPADVELDNSEASILRCQVEEEMGRLAETYGTSLSDELEPYDLGVLHGRLAALRWALGSEWSGHDGFV